jgi:hypothetical protein
MAELVTGTQTLTSEPNMLTRLLQCRMIEVTKASKVIYKTEHNAVGRFPQPGDEELAAGLKQVYESDPLRCPSCGSELSLLPRLSVRENPRIQFP